MGDDILSDFGIHLLEEEIDDVIFQTNEFLTDATFTGAQGPFWWILQMCMALAALFAIIMAAGMAYKMMVKKEPLDVMKLFKPLAVAVIMSWWYPPADTVIVDVPTATEVNFIPSTEITVGSLDITLISVLSAVNASGLKATSIVLSPSPCTHKAESSALLVIVTSLSVGFTVIRTLSLLSSAVTVIVAEPALNAFRVLPSVSTDIICGLFDTTLTSALSADTPFGIKVNSTVLSAPPSYQSDCKAVLLLILTDSIAGISFTALLQPTKQAVRHKITVNTIIQSFLRFIVLPPNHILRIRKD